MNSSVFVSITIFVLSAITLLTQTWATMSKFWVEGSQAGMTLGFIAKIYRIGLYDVCETEVVDGKYSFKNATCESVTEAGFENYEQLKKMDHRGYGVMYFSAPACCLFSSISVMMNGMMIGMVSKNVRELIEWE